MTVFFCAKCGNTLTPDLRRLPAVPDVSTHDKDRDRRTGLAASTVPPGHYAIDPEPWGAPFEPAGPGRGRVMNDRALLMPPGMADLVSAGPRNTVIVHPDDTPDLRQVAVPAGHHGCCGPLGTSGRNMACTCGTLVATLAADCMGPHELHLDPVRVYGYDEGASGA
ncbi:hypothetical protein [Streptomyces sp. NPDC045470]|uniref:hypothetical protein n=1 Tax=Streptomyces sp. NPDC045470 TaxID=3155469 RepID=UPI0033D87ABD